MKTLVDILYEQRFDQEKLAEFAHRCVERGRHYMLTDKGTAPASIAYSMASCAISTAFVGANPEYVANPENPDPEMIAACQAEMDLQHVDLKEIFGEDSQGD